MKATATQIPDVLVLEPDVYPDERGFFFESFNRKKFKESTKLDVQFVQDNQSHSLKGVLRGLHYQIQRPQGKLVSVIEGEIFDAAVDLRRNSPSFGKWTAITVSAENKKQVWIPPGLAHGFLVLSKAATVLYKVTDYYAPQHERTLIWNDPAIGIAWPAETSPILSAKDRLGLQLGQAEVFE
ncbi:MAG TPA: dTDP-4-dehydrorhamnose 3,5-epimerase [Candidatus Binataceae bacterium]|nr:dTDP-4-dehydrorhamnose 3,5-epimerase [Candidatus Binataceae bacterium]